MNNVLVISDLLDCLKEFVAFSECHCTNADGDCPFCVAVAAIARYDKPKYSVPATITDLIRENKRLRQRVLSAAGDDLCRLTPEEIKAYTSGAVQIPPEDEFIPSCKRFHKQIATEAGILTECLTLAQMIAENERLRQALEEIKREDGVGLDLSPAGKCYEIADNALNPPVPIPYVCSNPNGCYEVLFNNPGQCEYCGSDLIPAKDKYTRKETVMTFREPTLREEQSAEAGQELQHDLKVCCHVNDYLMSVMRDIAGGCVSKYDPSFLSFDKIKNETKKHFQERLNTFLQSLAKTAVINVENNTIPTEEV